MKVGTIVCGKSRVRALGAEPLLVSSNSRDALLAYGMNMFDASKNTIELWKSADVYGMIVKIDKDISGYGTRLALVLMERRTIWFYLKDLKSVKPPKIKHQI